MQIFAAVLSACLAIPRGDVAAALAQYDRQIATLRSLVAVPGLQSTVRIAKGSDVLSRSISARAAADVSGLAHAARPYALVDPSSVESALQSAYAIQASAVRAQAQREYDAYAQALAQQVKAQSAALETALARRVDEAYAARLQLYDERENDAFVARETAVANRQLQLRLKLAALAGTAGQRHDLEAQLDAIDRSIAASAAADHARDGAALGAYRRSLEAAASAEYATAVADLRRKAATNLKLRRAVTSAQQSAPASLAIDFDAPLRAAMAGGASSVLAVQSSQGTTAQQTEADFTASGNDIAAHFSSIAASDAANTASTRAQLTQIERARATLAAAAASNSCTSP